MSYGIGANVEVIIATFTGRWIYLGERGVVVGSHFSLVGQEVYDVRLEDGKVYAFAPSEIRELIEA